MNKLIRELRMGAAKQFKTGAVVGTYPRPLLVLNFDESGLDVIKEPIVEIKAANLAEVCKNKEQPPLSVVDLCDSQKKVMTVAYTPLAAKIPFQSFVDSVNTLVNVGCPWKTVVLDSVSGLGDVILAHIADVSSSSLASALKWAPMIGNKIYQCMGVMTALPCHVVFICHCSSPDKDETTATVDRSPLVPSKWLRDRIGTLVSQFFYQEIVRGVAMVSTTNDPAAYVKGIGARWPDNLPPKVGADFKSIYGKVL